MPPSALRSAIYKGVRARVARSVTEREQSLGAFQKGFCAAADLSSHLCAAHAAGARDQRLGARKPRCAPGRACLPNLAASRMPNHCAAPLPPRATDLASPPRPAALSSRWRSWARCCTETAYAQCSARAAAGVCNPWSHPRPLLPLARRAPPAPDSGARASRLAHSLHAPPTAAAPRPQEFSGEQLWAQFAPHPQPGPLPPALSWLRTIVTERMCAHARRHLLAFATGLLAIPLGGLRQKISVELEEAPYAQLPVAHTCALTLRISRGYDSLEHLQAQLARSISVTVGEASHGEGFQMK